VRTPPEVLADLDRRAWEARRRHAGNPPPRPPLTSRAGRDNDTLGDDQGDSGLPGQGIADIAVAVVAEVLRRTVGRAVKKQYQERVVPQFEQKHQELRRRQREVAERYPDLRYCVDDRVLFLIGSTRTVPLDQFLKTADQADAIVASLRAP
jgi:hypothetical protein